MVDIGVFMAAMQSRKKVVVFEKTKHADYAQSSQASGEQFFWELHRINCDKWKKHTDL